MWWALPGSNWFSSNSWWDSRTQGLGQTVSQYRLDSLGRLWAINNGKQQSNTLFNSICNLQYMFNINTWLMTNHTQNGPQKSWQVETPSRVGKSRCCSCFSMFLSCISWMTARCTMLASGGLPSNRESAHVCTWYASSFPAWKRTYHDLPWRTAVYKVVRGWNPRTHISKLWDPHPQCREEMASMLVSSSGT